MLAIYISIQKIAALQLCRVEKLHFTLPAPIPEEEKKLS